MPDERVKVHMSRSAVGQVIANLLDNSIYWLSRHHGDGKGGQIQVSLSIDNPGFSICVADDGPGVPTEDRDLIFEMNYTKKPNGMGLGLFVARQVIEHYGRLILRDDCALPGACLEAIFENNTGM